MPRRTRNLLQPVDDGNPLSTSMDSINSKNEANIDSYLSSISTEVSSNYSEKDAEIEVLTEENNSLKEKVKELEDDNIGLFNKITELLQEVSKLSNSIDTQKVSQLQEYNKKLTDENGQFILRNSELEFEIARLTETLKHVQSKIDANLHTYTKPGYSNIKPKDKILKNRPIGFVPSTNGYQDWC